MTSDNKPKTPADVTAMIEEYGIQMIDLKFCDLPGTWQHFTIPLIEYEEKLFGEGTGFDGSSIRGFQAIHESDMLVVPDPTTAMIDPFTAMPTLSLICDIVDPSVSKPYARDPRLIAKKAEAFLKESGIGDVSFWGPELEFFIFDSVRFDQNANSGYYFVDSDEGIWNSGSQFGPDEGSNLAKGPNLGNKIRHKEGYFPVPPMDTQQDIRSDMVQAMVDAGIHIEKHHHEVASGGQAEIDMRFDSLLSMADKVLVYKYLVKNVAREHGKVATFMPKPLFGDNGTGMHVHQSIWKNGVNQFFADQGYANLSSFALHYIGGLLKHAPALLAFCAPTTNSYKRLVPGFEAPVNLAYSMRNRSACCRIPAYFPHPAAKRVEFRCPDPTANPYLAFSAMLMAGLDGVINQIDPGQPLDKDIYNMSAEEASGIQQVPGSLEESLNALKNDHEFLLRGDVFTKDLIDTWIDFKTEREVDPMRLRPHPYEYALYLDA